MTAPLTPADGARTGAPMSETNRPAGDGIKARLAALPDDLWLAAWATPACTVQAYIKHDGAWVLHSEYQTKREAEVALGRLARQREQAPGATQ